MAGFRPWHSHETVERTVSPLDAGDRELLVELYAKLQGLNAEGRNGIWPRIIKNNFAPVFMSAERFDLVIGNPPWVNWESLSDEYRRATLPLWQEYGLFSLRGHAARLGGGKKDLSMLMLYAAAQHYLRPHGTLAFLVTQTLFKCGRWGPWTSADDPLPCSRRSHSEVRRPGRIAPIATLLLPRCSRSEDGPSGRARPGRSAPSRHHGWGANERRDGEQPGEEGTRPAPGEETTPVDNRAVD